MAEHSRPLSDHELARCSDDALVAHARERPEDLERVFCHLLDRHLATIKARVVLRVPAHVVEDVTQEVFAALFDSLRRGAETRRFRAWLGQLTANVCHDYYRRHGEQLKRDREAAVREHAEPAPLGPATEGGYDAVAVRELIEQVLADRSDAHRSVIELYVLAGLPAADVAAATGESADNVYQVGRRFRTDLRRLLEGDTGAGP